MGPINLKYYYEDMDRHGNIRRYFRRKGQRKFVYRVRPVLLNLWMRIVGP